jgi:hypothetical protein
VSRSSRSRLIWRSQNFDDAFLPICKNFLKAKKNPSMKEELNVIKPNVQNLKRTKDEEEDVR